MPAQPHAVCHVDCQRRTCIVLTRTKKEVTLIRLGTEDGYMKAFSVESAEAAKFDGEWKPLPDYPAEKGARLYAAYARDIGATEEAMHELAKLTKVTEEDIAMATAKQAATPVKSAVKGSGPKNEKETRKASVNTGTDVKSLPANGKAKEPKEKPEKAVGKSVAAKKSATAKPAPAKSAGKPAADKAKGGVAGKPGTKTNSIGIETAADMFRTLIREGKLTDDEIFAKVQAKFKLADNKRSYVSWYRNSLLKAGEKVPAAKK